jgi:hypothetical protein
MIIHHPNVAQAIPSPDTIPPHLWRFRTRPVQPPTGRFSMSEAAILCNIESSTLGVLGLMTPIVYTAFVQGLDR